MAGGFVITAQIQLRGPANINSVVSNLQKQLSGINANVNVQVPQNVGAQLSNLGNQLGSINKALTNVGANRQATVGLNNVGRSFTNVANQAGGAKTAAFELGEAIGQAGRKFAAFSVAAGTLVAFIGTIKEGISAAVDFQHEIVRLQQIGGDFDGSIAGISQEVTKLSTNLGVSSKSLLTVATTLRQAGLSGEDTRIALQSIAESSIAPTFTDMQNTVEGAIAAIQQFNLSAKDLYGIMGAINKVSAEFAIESDDIVHAIRRSGGAFKSAGGSLEELIALTTSVRQTTRESAETIASGFNTIFARIQRPESVEALRQMGVNLRYTTEEAKAFGKTEGEFVGPYEAVRRLNEALANTPTTSSEYAAIVEEIGGFRQVSKVVPLIQQFGTAERALQSAFTGTNSLAQSTSISQQSLIVQLNKLKESFFSLFREIGENKVLQEYASIFLKLAEGAIKLARALEPLVPLIATLALAKGLTTVGRVANTGFTAGLKKGLTTNTRFASGGVVPGVGNSDTVQAMLTPGEFVIKKSAARNIGYDRLSHINKHGMGGRIRSRFETGGLVSDAQAKEDFDYLDRIPHPGERQQQKLQNRLMKKMKSKGVSLLEANTKKYATGGVVHDKDNPEYFRVRPAGSLENLPVNEWHLITREQAEKFYSTGKLKYVANNENLELNSAAAATSRRKEVKGSVKEKRAGNLTKNDGLLLPLPGDKVGMILGEGGINNAGVRVINATFGSSVNKQLSDASIQTLERLGTKKISLVTTVHTISDKATQRFEETINGPVSKAISTSLDNAFPYTDANYELNNVEKKAISGTLFERFVQGFSKTNLSPEDSADNRHFDFPKGVRRDVNEFNTALFPTPVKSNLVDIKNSFSGGAKESMIGKYINYRLNDIAKLEKKAGGGKINAPARHFAVGGQSTGTDTVPALLTPGEFVINREAAQKIGYNKLHAMNRYAKGGRVFKVEAMDQTGKEIKKQYTGVDEDDIYRQVRADKLFLTEIKDITGRPPRKSLKQKFKDAKSQIAYELSRDPKVPKAPTSTREKIFGTSQIETPIEPDPYPLPGRQGEPPPLPKFGVLDKLFGREKAAKAEREAQAKAKASATPKPFVPPAPTHQFPNLGFGNKQFAPEDVVPGAYRYAPHDINQTGIRGQITAGELAQELDTPIGKNTRAAIYNRGKRPTRANRAQAAQQANDDTLDQQHTARAVAARTTVSPIPDTKSEIKVLNDILQAIKDGNKKGSGGGGRSRGPRTSRPAADEVTPTEEPSLLDKIKGNKGKIFGGAAVLGAQFLPQISEGVLGTVDKPGIGGTTGARVGSAATSAIAGAGTGALIGSSAGPVGTVVGGVVGGLYGAATSLKETGDRLKEIDFAESMKTFNYALEKAANNLDKLDTGNITDLRAGLNNIVKKADASSDRKEFFASGVNREQLNSLQARVTKDIGFTSNDDTSAKRIDKFLQAGNGLGKELARIQAEAQGISLADYTKQLDEILKRAAIDQNRIKVQTDLSNAVSRQTHSFEDLTKAVVEAKSSISGFQGGLDNIQNLTQGTNFVPDLQGFSTDFSSVNTQNFTRTANLISNTFKDSSADLANNLRDTAVGINQAMDALPSALTEFVSKGPEGNPEQFRSIIKKQGGGVPENVIDQLTKSLTTFPAEDRAEKIRSNPFDFAEELVKKAFPPVLQAFETIAKELKDRFQQLGASLLQYEEIGNKVRESQGRVANLTLDFAKTQYSIAGRRVGRQDAANEIPVPVLNLPLQAAQENLTGRRGPGAFDPKTLGDDLRGLGEKIAQATKVRDAAIAGNPSGKDVVKATADLANLSNQSQRLKQALENLTNVGEQTANAQERLGQIQREEAERLSLAEEYVRSDLAGRSKIRFNLAATGQAVQQGNLNGFDSSMRGAILDTLHKLENIRTPALGGLTGKEALPQLLRNDPDAFARSTVNLPGQKESERVSLENQVLESMSAAVKAQTELTNFLQTSQDTFFTKLAALQSAFFTNLSKNALEARQKDLTVGKTSAETDVKKIQDQQKAVAGLAAQGFPDLKIARAAITKDSRVGNLVERNKEIGGLKDISTKKEVFDSEAQKRIAKAVGDFKARIGPLDFASAEDIHALTTAVTNEIQNIAPGIGDAGAIREQIVNPALKTHEDYPLGGTQVAFSDIGSGNPTRVIDAVVDSLKKFSNTRLEDLNQKQAIDLQGLKQTVPGINDKQVNAILTNFDALSKLLDTLKDVSNTDQLSTSFKTASEKVDEFGGKLNAINLQIDKLKTEPGVAVPPVPAEPHAKGGAIFSKSAYKGIFKARGTDTIPAMLSPGEFVVNASSAKAHHDVLTAINSGTNYKAAGGSIRRKKKDIAAPPEYTEADLAERPLDIPGQEVPIFDRPIVTPDMFKKEKLVQEQLSTDSFTEGAKTQQQIASATLKASGKRNNPQEAKALFQITESPGGKEESPAAIARRKYGFYKTIIEKHPDSPEAQKSIGLIGEVGRQAAQADINDANSLATRGESDPQKKREAFIGIRSRYPNTDASALASYRLGENADLKPSNPLLPKPAPLKGMFDLKKPYEGFVQETIDKQNAISQEKGRDIAPPSKDYVKQTILKQAALTKQKADNQNNFVPQVADPTKQAALISRGQTINKKRIARGEAPKDFGDFARKSGLQALTPEQYLGQNAALAYKGQAKRAATVGGFRGQDPYLRTVNALNPTSQDKLDALAGIKRTQPQPVDRRRKPVTRKQFLAAQGINPNTFGKPKRLRNMREVHRAFSGISPQQEQAAGFMQNLESNVARFQNERNNPSNQLGEIKELLKKKNVAKRFALGGQARGTDVVPAMLTPGEFIVSSDAARANIGLLNHINSGKPVYRQRGGSIQAGVSSSNAGVSDIALNQESLQALNNFNAGFSQAVGTLTEPLNSFTNAASTLNNVIGGFQQLIGPLNNFAQNIQLMKAPFDAFNTSSTNLGIGLAMFNKNAEALASALNNLANLPKTITVQGNTNVNVSVTGAEAFKAITDQVMAEVKQQVIAQLKPEIIADLKNGNVVG